MADQVDELFSAIGAGDVEQVGRLSKKADVNAGRADEPTVKPIMAAAWTGKVAIGRLLRDAGADLNATDKANNDVLSYAIEHPQFILFLEENGLDIHRMRNGATFIGECITTGLTIDGGLADTVAFLVGRGVRPMAEEVEFVKKLSEPADISPKAQFLMAVADFPEQKRQGVFRPYARMAALLESVPVRDHVDRGTITSLADVTGKLKRGPRPQYTIAPAKRQPR